MGCFLDLNLKRGTISFVMKAIILAGGLGTRIRGQRAPKPLIKVGGVTLIDRLIRQLMQSGVVQDVIFSLGYRAKEVRDHLNNYPPYLRSRFQYVYEKKALGTGGAIKRAFRCVADENEPILFVNADIISNIDPAVFAGQHAVLESNNVYAVTLAAVHVSNVLEYGHLQYDPKTWKIRSFREKIGGQQSGVINAGWYVLTKKAFLHHAPEKSDVFSIERDVFPLLAASGNLRLYPHRGFWNDVGTVDRLKGVRSQFT